MPSSPDSLSQRPPVDEDLAAQARPGHGVPSQDPDPAAQVPLSSEEAEREQHSVLAGGGVMVGAATGAAIGTAVAGPVGTLVGGTVGAVAGALGGVAAGGLATSGLPGAHGAAGAPAGEARAGDAAPNRPVAPPPKAP